MSFRFYDLNIVLSFRVKRIALGRYTDPEQLPGNVVAADIDRVNLED